MSQSSELQIKMLGGFSITCGEKSISRQDNRSKKPWLLLEYLVAYRNSEISQDDLIELLWPNEQSENPGNALKTLLHRVRAILNQLEYRDSHTMVVHRHGSYAWNTEMPFTVDVDEFERACQAGDAAQEEEQKLSRYLTALSLYQGDFLPELGMESWVLPISTYYHAMFLRAAHESVEILERRERYEEIVSICRSASLLDPYDEFLHYHLILALFHMGKQQAALDCYASVTDLYFTKFGVTPSKELTALYKEIIKSSRRMETDLTVIQEDLMEQDRAKGAFYCEYEFFKSIYHLEARAAGRTGQSICLCLLTVTDGHGNPPPLKQLNSCMEKLKMCIQTSLRRGDLFSRYSVAQYILMLPVSTLENAEGVIERILKNYRRENPRSSAYLIYRLQPLKPVGA